MFKAVRALGLLLPKLVDDPVEGPNLWQQGTQVLYCSVCTNYPSISSHSTLENVFVICDISETV